MSMKYPSENRPLIEWSGTSLRFIDQTKLPDEMVFVETDRADVIAGAIRNLGIRGAPAIGVAAAYAVVLAARTGDGPLAQKQRALDAAGMLSRTRPTAVNLFAALERMKGCLTEDHRSPVECLETEAKAIHSEDIEACRKIARFGAPLISPRSSVLTHCHTGALATGGGGTALNVILEAFRNGCVDRVYVDETRPLLQGARLTAWELLGAGVETILITDSTAGYLMKLGRVDAVFVGADRIAANGDVANKIGTYSLAALARVHAVPFYVVAPLSTVDPATPAGEQISIEERSSDEVTHLRGTRIAPAEVKTFAPAFDVTPHGLVTAIVTDAGVLRPPYKEALKDLAVSQLPETGR